MLPESDRYDQLSEHVLQTASTLETQGAQLAGLVARIAALESQVAAGRSAAAEASERIERLARELDVSAQLTSLSAQLGAARAAEERLAHRVEQVATQLARLPRVEEGVGHVRAEMVGRLDELESSLRGDVRGLADTIARDRDSSGRALASLTERLDAARALFDRVAGVERRARETGDQAALVAARVEEVAAERVALHEAGRLTEQRTQARGDALEHQLDELRTLVDEWRGRIEAQEETVREARSVAAEMSARADDMAAQQHAAAEAQRVEEGRVESALQAMRDEIAERWQRFLAERRADWEALQRSRAQAAARTDDLESAVRAVRDDMEPAVAALGPRIDGVAEDVEALRRDAASAWARVRGTAQEAQEELESGLPADQQSAVASERREAMRRALRARREAREG